MKRTDALDALEIAAKRAEILLDLHGVDMTHTITTRGLRISVSSGANQTLRLIDWDEMRQTESLNHLIKRAEDRMLAGVST